MRTSHIFRGLDLTGLSPRHRRAIVLGVRGGAGDTATPIEDLLAQSEGHAELNDDDLGVLHELLRAGMVETLTAPVTDEDLATADQIRAALTSLETAADERLTADAERNTRAAELLASIADASDPEPDPTADPETDPASVADPDPAPVADPTADPEVDPVADPAPTADTDPEVLPIAASADPEHSVVTRVVSRRPDIRRPAPVRASAPDPHTVLRASAGGAMLDTTEKLADAFSTMMSDTDMMAPGRRVRVASLGARETVGVERMYGEGRFLDDNPHANDRKIQAVTSLQALRASGGVCAPSPIQYDQGVLGTDMRPVRDTMLARFGADRGGVQIIAPPQLNDTAVANGVTTWTNANDITPASPTTKNVTTIDCGTPTTTTVDAIVTIAKIGNFQSRYFRERVDAFMSKLAQAAARTAENKLLTAIGAGSTQVAHQTVLGTARDVLTHVDQSAAQIRSRYRLAPDFPLRLGLPDWFLDNMRSDLAREQPGAATERLAMTEQQLISFFAVRNINTSWFIDGESGQIFGAQGDGAALGWPSRVTGYLYPEGEWLFLDGGSLDLGVVRDSTLNGTNDYEIFAEVFENVARTNTGPSRRLDLDICPNGATALPISTAAVCTSGS